MLTIEKLTAYGADVPSGLSRCLDDEEFYLELVESAVADDGALDTLETALNGGDAKSAFEAAHALKGVYLNLALTPLYMPVSGLTELLRAGALPQDDAYLREIKAQFGALKALAG